MLKALVNSKLGVCSPEKRLKEIKSPENGISDCRAIFFEPI